MGTTLRRPSSDEGGFILVLSIIIMLILAISVPALIVWVRQETKDTVKVKQSSAAFHMAEAGVDQGVWKLQESQDTWTNAKTGAAVSGYDGATEYSLDFQNGTVGSYTIKFASGPAAGQVTVLVKGRDPSTREVRAIQAVMGESAAIPGTFAFQAKKTVSFGAATSVEWGPVIGKGIINSGGKTHPRLMTASNVSPNDGNLSVEPNTDGVQWWSYKTDLPPEPVIDFALYQASATALGAAPNGCGNGSSSSYYFNGNATFSHCIDTGGSGKVYYVTGSCSFVPAGGGNKIVADMICLQDFNATGNAGNLTESLTVPPQAWLEYGNDWAYYASNFDPGITALYPTFAAAKAANPTRTGLTVSVNNIIVHGFIYTGGSSGLTGGGNSALVGSLYSANNASLTTSGFAFYYDPVVSAGIHTTNVIITRASWKEVPGGSWP